MNELARERDWRLVGLTKAACPPAEVHIHNAGLRRAYSECDEWRKRMLERIVQDENPKLNRNEQPPHLQAEGGRQAPRQGRERRGDGGGLHLYPEEAAWHRGRGSAHRRRAASGQEHTRVRLALVQDYLERCASPRSKALDYPKVNTRAAKQVEGVSLIDPTPVLCPEKPCPAVIGDALVYRNGSHLTATYVRTLTPWLDERLPEAHRLSSTVTVVKRRYRCLSDPRW